MPRHIACITFDFDAMSGMIARGLTSATPISRGEFGAAAVPRLLDLLRKYSVRSTWFVPGFTLETYPAQNRAVFDAGHEIAHHGWTHVPPNDMSAEQEEAGLVRANEQIKKLTGQYARGYRSPSWDLSPYSIGYLLKHGFLYDTSMMGDDSTPYRCRMGDVVELEQPMSFGPATRLIEMPISWSLDDFPHFEYLRTKTGLMPGLMNANLVLENWINDFLYMKETSDWGVLTYTFHPFVIGRGHRMMALEKLLKRLSDEGAVFMTMEDAAREYDRRAPFAPAA